VRRRGLLRAGARLARVTCEDATDLAMVFAQVARRHVGDGLRGLRQLPGRRVTRGSARRP
jgi:hypothetical protein